MFKVHKREDDYIIEKIVKNLDEFILFLIMYYNFVSLININTVFLSINNVFKFTFTVLINVNTDLSNVVNKSAIVNKINYN